MVKKGTSENHLLKQLSENHAALQKTSLKLIESNHEVVKRIDKLVALFEEASKHVAEVEVDDDRVKVLVGKLETLLEQNKDIAKGLILLEKYVRGRSEFEPGIRSEEFKGF